MIRFLERMGRLFLNLVIILFILLISVQIILKNDDARERLTQVETAFQELTHSTQQVFKVTDDIKKGLLVLKVNNEKEQFDLSEIWLLQNGTKVANFSEGYLSFQVNDGDLITITSSYPETIEIFFEDVDDSISSIEKGQQFKIEDGFLFIKIKFEFKL